ncbi:unnamed protein product [Boreogadus saida]
MDLSQFLKDNSIDKCSTKEMCSHLKRLEEHFTTYFPDVDVSKFDWESVYSAPVLNKNRFSIPIPNTSAFLRLTVEPPRATDPEDNRFTRGLLLSKGNAAHGSQPSVGGRGGAVSRVKEERFKLHIPQPIEGFS